MELQIDQALARERLLAFLSTVLSCVALSLAAIGLYGVLSFSVVRRTREMGIRLAIGAQHTQILGLVLRQSAWMVLGGIVAGVPLAFASGSLIGSLLYGMEPHDIPTVVFAAVTLLTVAFAAALIPATRAARLEPMKALRYE